MTSICECTENEGVEILSTTHRNGLTRYPSPCGERVSYAWTLLNTLDFDVNVVNRNVGAR